jgi:hypothetical protein
VWFGTESKDYWWSLSAGINGDKTMKSRRVEQAWFGRKTKITGGVYPAAQRRAASPDEPPVRGSEVWSGREDLASGPASSLTVA